MEEIVITAAVPAKGAPATAGTLHAWSVASGMHLGAWKGSAAPGALALRTAGGLWPAGMAAAQADRALVLGYAMSKVPSSCLFLPPPLLPLCPALPPARHTPSR